MKLLYTSLILLFAYISCYCKYEGKSSQSFCSKRKVDYDEVPSNFKELFSQYKCCYIYVSIAGDTAEGCFSTSPTMIKDIPTCYAYYQNNNSNEDKDQDEDDDDDDEKNYNEYLLANINKIMLLSLLLL